MHLVVPVLAVGHCLSVVLVVLSTVASRTILRLCTNQMIAAPAPITASATQTACLSSRLATATH